MIKDFESLHFSTKTIALTILSTIPFFFISIYLFKPEMISIIEGNPLINIHFYFLISVCLSLSIIWFGLILLISMISGEVHEKQEKNKILEEIFRAENLKIEAVKEDSILEKKRKQDLRVKRKEMDLRVVFILTYILSISYISLAIFLNRIWLEWGFKMFLIGCGGFILLRILLLSFSLIIAKWAEKDLRTKIRAKSKALKTESLALESN